MILVTRVKFLGLLLIIAVHFSIPLFGNRIVVTNKFVDQPLLGKCKFYIDSNDVLSSSNACDHPDWTPHINERDLQYNPHNIWSKFVIINNDQEDAELSFNIGSAHVEEWVLYKNIGGALKEVESKKKNEYKRLAHLRIPAQDSTEYYLREYNPDFKTFYNASVYVPEKRYLEDHNTSFLSGGFYGVVSFVFIYVLILFTILKRRYMAFYALYVLFYGLMMLNYDGELSSFFPISIPHFHVSLSLKFIMLSYFFNFLFLQDFMLLKKYSKGLSINVKVLSIVSASLFLFSFVPGVSFIIERFIDLILLIFLINIIVITIIAFRKKIPNCELVLFSYLWVIICGMSMLFFHSTTSSMYEVQASLLKIGLVGELILLTVAITISIVKHQMYLQDRLKQQLEMTQVVNLQLEQANKKIEEVSHTKDQFMVTLSHELKTPLSSILGFAKLIREYDLSNSVKRLVDNVVVSSKAMLSSIDDILDFNTYTDLAIKSVHKDFNLENVLRPLVETYKFESKNQGVVFNVDVQDGVKRVYFGPQRRIAKMLSILLNNALNKVKSDKGEVIFRCELSDESAHSAKVLFTVGIKKTARISHNISKTDVSYALFEKLAASIDADFDFIENCEKVAFSVDLSYSTNELFISGKEKRFDRCRILLVDDDLLGRLVCEKHIQEINETIVVSTASSAEEALDKMKEEDYHLVFFNVDAALLDCAEFMRQLRNNYDNAVREIPVLGLILQEKDNTKCKDAGLNDYLEKPIHTEALRSLFDKWIK